MSGGVDLPSWPALLARQGHEVIGITLQLYDHGEATGRKGACCAGQDVQDARRVAAGASAFPITCSTTRSASRDAVMRLRSPRLHLPGETPIPCVTCNQNDQVRATCSTPRGSSAPMCWRPATTFTAPTSTAVARRSIRAADADRDQSYFLFATTREQLQHLWFPLGDMKKSEVRELARELGLIVADKSDSQDICFVLQEPLQRRHRAPEPRSALSRGDIVHVDGRHARPRTTASSTTPSASAAASRSPQARRFSLSRLNAQRNEVVVGPRDFLRLRKSLIFKNFNWLGDSEAFCRE